MMKKVLYIGAFLLPDRNAAANRVISNAKALRALGYDVSFCSFIKADAAPRKDVFFVDGFSCVEYPQGNPLSYLCSASRITDLVNTQQIDIVIAYNYPSVALNRLRLFCRRKEILCIADVTEWYQASWMSLYGIAKNLDSFFRMRYVHKKLDGLIVISEYLYRFYLNTGLKLAKIPPLVDMEEAKWNDVDSPHTGGSGKLTLVYAGSPSARKERLDLIVSAVGELSKSIDIKLVVVGIDLNEYCSMYNKTVAAAANDTSVVFLGRVSHKKALAEEMKADWSIVIRDNNRVVMAGFPTKVVESIACGTPVIANEFSNITEYLDHSNSVLVKDLSRDGIMAAIVKAYETSPTVKKDVFDYKNYLERFAAIFSRE